MAKSQKEAIAGLERMVESLMIDPQLYSKRLKLGDFHSLSSELVTAFATLEVSTKNRALSGRSEGRLLRPLLQQSGERQSPKPVPPAVLERPLSTR